MLLLPLVCQANGLPEQNVELKVFDRGGTEVDTVVAASALDPGATLLRIPERLVVTLDRIFQDATLAELLTTNKLSELACLALYLAYEKKRGAASFWHPFIRELDRLRGRGPQGARSPLLWEEAEVQEFLAGSPVLDQIQARIKVGGPGLRMLVTGLRLRWCRGGAIKGLSCHGETLRALDPRVSSLWLRGSQEAQVECARCRPSIDAFPCPYFLCRASSANTPSWTRCGSCLGVSSASTPTTSPRSSLPRKSSGKLLPRCRAAWCTCRFDRKEEGGGWGCLYLKVS